MNDAITAAYTAKLKTEGVELLNFWRLSDDEKEHVRQLLGMLDLPQGARVIDLGSGTGRLAALAMAFRPDLHFTLVNTSRAQLDLSPEGVTLVHGDMADTGCEAGAFDAVVLAYALGHGEAAAVLEEGARLLRPGGKLLVHDVFADTKAAADALGSVLNYEGRSQKEVQALAYVIGFDLVHTQRDEFMAPGPTVQEVKPVTDLLDHGVMVLQKSQRPHLFRSGRRVALSLSGGKDSLTCLSLFTAWWPNLTVYWMNPGNPFPETVDLMARIRLIVPSFKEVPGRQREVIAADGWPSDVVPQWYTTDGNAVFGATPFKVQSRLQCCLRALMIPAYQAMVDDGIDCCIRGKRDDEADKTGLKTGYVSEHGIELVFPLLEWTDTDVRQYLERKNIALPLSYEYARHSLDCMDCTAWWGEGLSRYLEAAHPEAFTEYRRRVILIKQAVADQLAECEV